VAECKRPGQWPGLSNVSLCLSPCSGSGATDSE
jgi:hypothetical protein